MGKRLRRRVYHGGLLRTILAFPLELAQEVDLRFLQNLSISGLRGLRPRVLVYRVWGLQSLESVGFTKVWFGGIYNLEVYRVWGRCPWARTR